MPIPTKSLIKYWNHEMNPNYEDDIGFTTWFKTINLPDYVGGGKKTVMWCKRCSTYNTINHVKLHSPRNNVLFLNCEFFHNPEQSYAFGIKDLITSFTNEYSIDPNEVKTTAQFVEMFNFIKTLE